MDMAHMLLVTVPLDMIQQGSLHMYQGFCLGMFLVNSLLSNAKYITMRNEQKNIYTHIGGDAAAAVGVDGADDDGDNGNKDSAQSSLRCMRMNYIWLAGSYFHEGFCKGHLKPLEDNSSTCLSFPVFHIVLQLYFDEVFFFVCNLLRTALDL